MGTKGALRVVEIPSDRWEIALDSLHAGGPLVLLGADPPVGLQRYVGWPNADGLVHASIFTSREPPGITLAEAELHARQGLEIIRRAQAADRRLTDLFAT